MAKENKAVQVQKTLLSQVRHPIKAARLLYSAPGVVLRGPIYLIFLIVFSALMYSFWAKKDVLVMAPLKLERESFTIQSTVGGLITQVHVRQGDLVETSDRLVHVQKTRVSDVSEKQTLSSRQTELSDEKEKLEKEFRHTLKQLEISLDKIRRDREIEKERYSKTRADYPRQIRAAEAKISTIKTQQTTFKDTVNVLRRKLRKAREDFKIEEELFKSRDITKSEYDRAKTKVEDLEKSVRDAVAEVRKTEVSLKTSEEEPERLKREKFKLEKSYRKTVEALNTQETKTLNEIQQSKERRAMEMAKLERKLLSTQKQIEEEKHLVHGVSHEGRQSLYTSTFSGLVTDVHVKPGHHVAVGSPLVTIVKESAALNARVLVKNQDIGRLKRGQTVQIKYFAYPYQEYGIPTGIITDIATKPGGVEAQPSMYIVKVALREETIRKMGGRSKQLEIGLEGLAEIKTGEKRFIELMFSPISKFFTQED